MVYGVKPSLHTLSHAYTISNTGLKATNLYIAACTVLLNNSHRPNLHFHTPIYCICHTFSKCLCVECTTYDCMLKKKTYKKYKSVRVYVCMVMYIALRIANQHGDRNAAESEPMYVFVCVRVCVYV